MAWKSDCSKTNKSTDHKDKNRALDAATSHLAKCKGVRVVDWDKINGTYVAYDTNGRYLNHTVRKG